MLVITVDYDDHSQHYDQHSGAWFATEHRRDVVCYGHTQLEALQNLHDKLGELDSETQD